MRIYIRRQLGMTMTELMIAIAVGLIVSTAVAGLFLQTTASNNQNEEITYLQDNGRYALKVLADDLEMSNFWAGLSASNRGSIQTDDDSITATIDVTIDQTATGCGGTANWNYDFDVSLAILVNTTGTDATTDFPCIDNADDQLDFIDTTDVLMVKRTKGLEETNTQTNGRPYIRSNRTVATVHKYVDASTDPPPTGFFDWEYLNRVYYIARQYNSTSGDCPACPPTLVRQTLKEDGTPANDPSFSTERIAEGIERFHIMWGVDTDADGDVDTMTSTPTPDELANAIFAKIYVLARGESEVTGYLNTKTYQLGDLAVDPNPDDGYYRRVFSTTVVMKNTEAILSM